MARNVFLNDTAERWQGRGSDRDARALPLGRRSWGHHRGGWRCHPKPGVCRPTTGPFRRGERLRPWGPGGGSEAEVPPAVYVTAK